MNEPAEFETAIEATGFGLFNIILLLAAIPSCLATVFETSTISFILPDAECDLQINMLDKGLLNAITYAGMVSSALLWGFIADTKGRKNVLVFGYLTDAMCSFGGALSQSFTFLMICKFFGGFVVCGPFAVLMSYMTEFHGAKYRSRVIMVIGMLFSIATLILPVVAWCIIPNSWKFTWFNGLIVIHSWQMFLAICALPSLTAAIIYTLLPESPKFLMARGRNEDALSVLKTVYSINNRKPKNTYPFSRLVEEVTQKKTKVDDKFTEAEKKGDKRLCNESMHYIRKGLRQLRPMFTKPYSRQSYLIYAIQFCVLLGLNTLRLWLPQLFSSISEYNSIRYEMNAGESSDLCAVLQYSIERTTSTISDNSNKCETTMTTPTYINTFIVGVAGLIGYLIAGGLINALGSKCILITGLTISGICGFLMYWATNSLTALVLSSIYVTVGSIGATSLLGIIVNLFPTSLRTMIVSVAMMCGRLGALIGNVLFPYFMSLGCLPPFLMVGSTMLIAVALGYLLHTNQKTIQK